jgi:ribosome maturation factor RimP
MEELRATIEKRINDIDPAIELIALERSGSESLRIFIDHPRGVDLALCERVSRQLFELTADWALEVSSPGLDRPLTKPEHYRRFLGSRVRVKTSEAVAGRRSFTGRLAAADDHAVRIEDDAGEHRIPLDRVRRSNLVPEFSEVRP